MGNCFVASLACCVGLANVRLTLKKHSDGLRALRLYALWFIREILLMFCKCFIWHLMCHSSFYIIMENYVFYFKKKANIIYVLHVFCFSFQSMNRLSGWFPSNQVFYQSDCELVTFDTVELFFLRKKKTIYWAEAGEGGHLMVSVPVILNSKVVSIKNVLKMCDLWLGW